VKAKLHVAVKLVFFASLLSLGWLVFAEVEVRWLIAALVVLLGSLMAAGITE